MKRIHTHYDNLKVARDAPVEVIRAAYRSLCQAYHPDRHPGDPEAARIMALINHSYEVLSDPEKRARHDRWIAAQESGSAAEEQPSEPPPHGRPEYEMPKAGVCLYEQLPEEAKARLVARVRGHASDQFAARLPSGVGATVSRLGLIVGWLLFLFVTARGVRWSDGVSFLYVIVSGVAAWFAPLYLQRFEKWRRSSLGACLIVTPVYIIHAEIDRVRFWPLWTLSNIKATHNLVNGIYRNTTVEMEVQGKRELFTIAPEQAYDRLVGALNLFDSRARAAAAAGDVHYFDAHDDFKGVDRYAGFMAANQPEKVTPPAHAAAFGLSALILMGVFALNARAPSGEFSSFTPSVAPAAPAAPPAGVPYTSEPPAAPAYVRPSMAPNGQPWPSGSGYVAGYQRLRNGGLSTVTVDNSRNNSDVFVKLVYLGASPAYPIRVFFIPAYGKFTVEGVEAGNYDVRYQDLDSGALTRTEPFNLQERPRTDGTEYSAVTMTLYKVPHGNMDTYTITESEF